MSRVRFEKKIRERAFEYLLDKQKEMKNGKNIKYESFRMQDYLLGSSPLSLDQKRLLFSLSIESRKNTTGFLQSYCLPPCLKEINNEHIYSCTEFSKVETSKIPYSKIFNGVLEEKLYITEKMEKIIKHTETRRP